jgi:hypothetical protein
MEERSIWMRLGVTLNGTKEEIESLFSDDYEVSRNALMKILTEGRFNFDGDSYIPEPSVEDYNESYGTEHEVGEVGFNL